MINYENFVENSRKWLEDYITFNHLQSIVCGVSGGIDSTVSLAIASPVCKRLGVQLIGRSLPAHSNNLDEINSAQLVGEAFCTDFKEVAIERMYARVADELELNEGKLTLLQLGNVKARLRMIYLRNLASIHRGVVLDNDNFTEWNTGFWTVGGDSPMDINLGLHYLWKTEIYELADYLCTEYMESTLPIKHSKQSEAIKASMSLIPTDGNGVSDSDCDQFGLDNYAQVDDVLRTMYYNDKFFEQWAESNQIYKKGPHPQYIRLIDSYNEQGVDKVMTLHQNTAYKRKKLPIKPTKEELGL